MTNDTDVTSSRYSFSSVIALSALMRRVVIGCLCAAGVLAAVGCADGVPTSPSVIAPMSSFAANTPSHVGAIPQMVVAAKEGRPFHGSFTASEANEFLPPDTLRVHGSSAGTASHFGRFNGRFDSEVVLGEESASGAGTFTLTAANGDTIFGTVTVVGTFVPGGVEIVEHATITGGTGRFTDATGSFTLNRSLVEATQLSSGSFDGTITY